MSQGVGPRGRGLLATVWNNFRKSFSPSAEEGPMVGRDPFGNTFYEVPADPSRGKRRPRRYYQASTTGQKDIMGKDWNAGFDSKMPSEWEAWLRHRRDQPPTDEQVLNSLAYAEMKKMNAAKLEEKRIEELKAEGRYAGPPKPQDHEKTPFPKYDEYEILGGESEFKNDFEKWAEFRNPYMDQDKIHAAAEEDDSVFKKRKGSKDDEVKVPKSLD